MLIPVKNFIFAFAYLIQYALKIYSYIIIARVVLSWVNPDPYNPIVRFISRLTDPVMDLVAKKLPVRVGGMDLSPIVIYAFILFLDKFIVGTLFEFATKLH